MRFHDYKGAGIDARRLQRLARSSAGEGAEPRRHDLPQAPDADKQGLDGEKAISLMLAQPSMIKRPILEAGGRRLIGFKEAEWAEALA